MNPYDYHDRMLLLRTQQAEVRERYGLPTFASTLKIPRARLWDQTLEALAIAEVIFHDWKCPEGREHMMACLDSVINTCNELGIPFPAVFLLRRRELKDGEFVSERTSAAKWLAFSKLFEVRRRSDGR